jgi:hypothetical protein
MSLARREKLKEQYLTIFKGEKEGRELQMKDKKSRYVGIQALLSKHKNISCIYSEYKIRIKLCHLSQNNKS